MPHLIATQFLSVADLVNMGFEIPAGTPLYTKTDHELAGNYVEHVKSSIPDLDYHTMSNRNFKSTPIFASTLGILITRPYPIEAVKNHLAGQAKAFQTTEA